MSAPAGRRVARLFLAPAVMALFVWMVVPLGMTMWFAAHDEQLLLAGAARFVGWENFTYIFGAPGFLEVVANTVALVAGVLAISIVGGVGLACLMDQPIFGRRAARLLIVAPFFVMPTVSALVWKNLVLNPVNGLAAWASLGLGIEPVDWLGAYPLFTLIMIVGWGWMPFAALILLTALQSLDREQLEAAEMDGAGPLARFAYVILPHLARPIAVVTLIETIFLLSLFAEILVTTNGGPGSATTNLAYLVYAQALLRFDVGAAAAAGLIAVVFANLLAAMLIRTVGRDLET